jgi:hypothetical protein
MPPTQGWRHRRDRRPLYLFPEPPFRVPAAGCWTVGPWPTGVRVDQLTSAHRAGWNTRGQLGDIGANTRATHNLSRRDGPGMRMNTSGRQVLGVSRRALAAPGPGRVLRTVHVQVHVHWGECSAWLTQCQCTYICSRNARTMPVSALGQAQQLRHQLPMSRPPTSCDSSA